MKQIPNKTKTTVFSVGALYKDLKVRLVILLTILPPPLHHYDIRSNNVTIVL